MVVAAGILGGGLAAGSHATKAGSRVMINASPEPFTNWFASVSEDVAVFGGLWAAPIASLMIEKYLKGNVSRDRLEKRMLDGSLEEEYNKQLEIESYVAQKEE